eukprot:TRINITY_DN18001_c0_g2_i1.p1 TRINITY_DN18001_c0_g2~~TRINITY_DN18001_c0_g2_i1.p1  ORF type:complete len:260 (-),score=56.36 TRINITY_DN18001_c0_g2_i1:506-1285(-)
MAMIPDDVKKQLMSDPKVQAAIKDVAAKTGKDALDSLSDPVVQAKIVSTCQEKFPEYADRTKQQITQFVNDPEVQKQAKHYAGIAGAYLMSAGGGLVAQIQQGPKGVRFLSFLGGVGSVANSILALINPFGAILNPIKYVLAVYQMLFSVTTILFEAPPEYIQKVSGIDRYQDMLMEKANFLSECLGRGLFYIFQGTLWLCFASSFADLIDLGCGAYMVLVGVLNLLVHFGGLTIFAEKVAEGYQTLAQTGRGSSAGQP